MELCIHLEELVSIADEVKDLSIHIAYTISWLEYSRPLSRYPYEDDIANLMNYVKANYTLENLKNHKVVRAYRDFFWRLGIDPTKTRPASEALVRRAIKNQFPKLNHIVDAGNIASVYTLVPIGMYDLDKIKTPLAIKYSRGGEIFRPIGGREEILGKRLPILVDSRDIVMHIYPHRDSIETCITDTTKKIVTIAAGVPGVERGIIVKAIAIVVELLHKIGWRSCEEIVYKV